ncbi:hypothetical protein ACHHYP_07102 [Achlya hypogyna]|uniref:Uncharacterized protein n=1 Tax=Achlya hypogyna TaxID=1202772 RepID=A0A1V9ZMP3_ACHHY|nr:hypothetical protein ACHHYP_07102 [Achlya hypogyna]
MQVLLYAHVGGDHFVIACDDADDIARVMALAEEAYASIFREKPPVTVRALTSSTGCFLPPSIRVASVLETHAHVYAVVDDEPRFDAETSLTMFKRAVATWSNWQHYMAQTILLIVRDSTSIPGWLACGGLGVLSALLFTADIQSTQSFARRGAKLFLAALRLALEAFELVMNVDCLGAARVFSQLLATKRLGDDPFVPTTLLRLLHRFCVESREAQTVLLEEGLVNRLLLLVGTVKTPEAAQAISATLCLLQESALRRPKSSKAMPSSVDPPSAPIEMQQVLYLMHSRQPKSLDAASRQLQVLTASPDDWAPHAATERAIFAELLHVARGFDAGNSGHMTVLARLFTSIGAVGGFSNAAVVVDAPAVAFLVAVAGPGSIYPVELQAQALSILGQSLQHDPFVSNLGGVIGLLRSALPDARGVVVDWIHALLKGAGGSDARSVKDALVLLLLDETNLALCVDTLYCVDQRLRTRMLDIVNILLQEEEARDRVMDEFNCVPAFVSLLLDGQLSLEGRRLAAKALAKLALSS